MAIYDFQLTDIDSNPVSMGEYRGKVLLIVNTASKCGFTPQFQGLEKLYQDLGPESFTVLGFPCDQFAHQEPGTSDEIKGFCQLNYGVTFPLFEKIDVNGENAHPLFKYLKDAQSGVLGKELKWNFTKFLVDKNGEVVGRYAPSIEPEELRARIVELMK